MTQSAGKPLTNPPVSWRVRIFIALAAGLLWAVIFWQLTARYSSNMGWASSITQNTTSWKGYPEWLWCSETRELTMEAKVIDSSWSVHGWNMSVALAVAAAPVGVVLCIALAAFRRFRLQRSTWWLLVMTLLLSLSLPLLWRALWPQVRLCVHHGWPVDMTHQEFLCEAAVLFEVLLVLTFAAKSLLRRITNRRARQVALAQNHDWTHETTGAWDEGRGENNRDATPSRDAQDDVNVDAKVDEHANVDLDPRNGDRD